MREIEVKVLEIDKKEVERKLSSLGAKKVFEGVLEAEYFDFEDQSLRKRGIALRIRRENEKYFLTMKKKVHSADLKIRDEYEVEVSGQGSVKRILESLGMQGYGRIRKRRVTYALKGAKFEIDSYLDEYSFVPEFVEIEAKEEDVLRRCAELLGFRRDDCKPWTMIDTIRHYQKKRKLHGTVD